MNYGQRALELMQDLKRSDFIPAYNDTAVRAALDEISLHFDELNDQYEASVAASTDGKPPIDTRPSLLLHAAAVNRNKRILLAYHHYRVEKMRKLRCWDTAAALPPHVRSLLSEAEVDFYTEYDKLNSRYNSSLGGLDLNSNLQPPEEDFIEVRVVKGGLGTIVMDYWGEVSLELGTTHYLSRGDVEHLVRQGALQQLDAEETM